MTSSSSPRKDLTGIGSGNRPSAVDLGRGTGNNAEEILINEYMKMKVQRKKHKNRPTPHDQSVNIA